MFWIYFIYARTYFGTGGIKGVPPLFIMWNNRRFCRAWEENMLYYPTLYSSDGDSVSLKSVSFCKGLLGDGSLGELSWWWLWWQLHRQSKMLFCSAAATQSHSVLLPDLCWHRHCWALSCQVSQWVQQPVEQEGVWTEGPGQSQGGAGEAVGAPRQEQMGRSCFSLCFLCQGALSSAVLETAE